MPTIIPGSFANYGWIEELDKETLYELLAQYDMYVHQWTTGNIRRGGSYGDDRQPSNLKHFFEVRFAMPVENPAGED